MKRFAVLFVVAIAAVIASSASASHGYSYQCRYNCPPIVTPPPPVVMAAAPVTRAIYCTSLPGTAYDLDVTQVKATTAGYDYTYVPNTGTGAPVTIHGLVLARYVTGMVPKGASCDGLPGLRDLGYKVMSDGEKVAATTGPAPVFGYEAWG